MQLIEEQAINMAHDPSARPSASRLEFSMATVANVAFHDVTMKEAVDAIVRMVKSGSRGQYVCTGNLDHLLLLQKDDQFRSIYAEADLVVADGMPVVWLSHLKGKTPLRERVAGSDLFWHLARISHRDNIRLFFLGGAPGAAERAADQVRKRYPNVNICGIYCPPYEAFGTAEEESNIQDQVNRAQPDILFVGFGAPKQEKWIARNRDLLNVSVSIGIGGTFEMAGGLVKRAPLWAQRSGLEWLYRMAQDPRRLWRRYLAGDLPFFARLCFAAVRDSVHDRNTGAMPSVARQVENLRAVSTTPIAPLKQKNEASLSSIVQQ